MTNKLLRPTFIFFCMLLLLPAAVHAKPIGYAQTALGDVFAVQEGTSRSLEKGGPVYVKDTIVTKGGKTQIFFLDKTRLSIGPNSAVKLEEYRFNRRRKDSNALKFLFGPGFFRVLTGIMVKVNPDNFEMDAPYGSLGIRGTETASNITTKERALRTNIINQLAQGQNVNDYFNSRRESADYHEEHMHVQVTRASPKAPRSKSLNLAYVDLFNKEVVIPYPKAVVVTKDKGVSQPRNPSSNMSKQLAKTKIDRRASIPKQYQSKYKEGTLGTSKGGQNNSSSSDGQSSGGHSSGGHSSP